MKTGGRNIHNLRSAGDTIFLEESSSDFKQLLMKVKEESAKAGLNLNITKTKINTEEYTTLTLTMKTLKLVKIMLTVAQSSIQMESAARKSRLRLVRAAMGELER